MTLISISSLGQELVLKEGPGKEKLNAFAISLGKPWYPDMSRNFKNNSISFLYSKNLNHLFSFDIFYSYAQANNYPDFFSNTERLDSYIMALNYWDLMSLTWDEIYDHSMGIKGHFLFVHNNRWFVSANLAGGVFTSWSSAHVLPAFRYNYTLDKVIEYETAYFENRLNGYFYMPGVTVKYNLHKSLFIGLDIGSYRFVDKKDVWHIDELPVSSDKYMISFNLGFKF